MASRSQLSGDKAGRSKNPKKDGTKLLGKGAAGNAAKKIKARKKMLSEI